MYLQGGQAEIALTHQFEEWNGSPELSLVATQAIPTKMRIPFLTASTSVLSPPQEKALGRDGKHGPQNFSIFTQRDKQGRLLLGPVRFANVSS